MIFLWLLLWLPVKTKTRKSLHFQRFRAGDERIELPPKVLETPIIPFDQSPTKYIIHTFKTTYMLTFPWELTSCVADWVLYSSGVTSQLRCSVSFASQMFSLYQECFSTSKLAPNPSCSILPLPRLVGQALTRLVTVSSMCCHTSTSALSTSSSSRGFTSFEWDISS